MPGIALIRQDTLTAVLTLDGIISGDHVYEGTITDHAMDDRSTRTDGITIRPRRLSLSGMVGSIMADVIDGPGPGRIARVVDTLRDLQIAQVPLTVQIPGRAGIRSMGIESFSEGFDSTSDAPLVIDFKELLTASRETVTLAAINAGPPRADVAPGLEDTQERGELPNISFAQSIRRSVSR